jgi:hypothetical protein
VNRFRVLSLIFSLLIYSSTTSQPTHPYKSVYLAVLLFRLLRCCLFHHLHHLLIFTSLLPVSKDVHYVLYSVDKRPLSHLKTILHCPKGLLVALNNSVLLEDDCQQAFLFSRDDGEQTSLLVLDGFHLAGMLLNHLLHFLHLHYDPLGYASGNNLLFAFFGQMIVLFVEVEEVSGRYNTTQLNIN